MYSYQEIKTVHLEITERCNASCPQCSRNINGGETNQYLKDRELYLEDIVKIFPTSFVQQLNHIYMCGNYGDPIVAKDTLEVFRYFRECNPNIILSMNTNGSARTPEYWIELAKILGKNGYIIFSIDGLKDTNHLYRRNTNWDKIVDNVTAFISANGIAHWEYIVFEHNEYQIEEAQQLANALGFAKFQLKKTARFSSVFGNTKEGTSAVDKRGKKIEIGLPKNPNYRNTGIKNYAEVTGITKQVVLPTTLEEISDKLNPELFVDNPVIQLYDKTTVDCKVKREKSIFITAEGIVQPCCWIANQMYPWYHSPRGAQIWKYINKIGIDNINAHNKSVEEIINSGYFDQIAESWDKPTCKSGKLAICARTCGLSLETFNKQYV